MMGFINKILGKIPRSINVRHGDQTINARPHFDEAFKALPYINAKYKEHFADVFAKYWDKGTIERTMLKSGLPDDFFQNLGDKSPSEAIKAIFMRAFCRIVAEARKRDEDAMKASGFFPFKYAMCDINDGYCCKGARKFGGKVVTVGKRTEFPLKGCDADWCNCTWILTRKK